MMVVQNLAKENYLLKFKMAAMPIYGKKHSNDCFSRIAVPVRLIFCIFCIWGTSLYRIAKIVPVGS